MTVNQKIEKLRNRMRELGADAYLIVSEDYHGSEYVGDYFKEREFMSGFTGSAGTLLFTQKDAFLWTDGRYFLQAERQLNGSGIQLMKSGEPNVPTLMETLKTVLPKRGCLAFDGRTLSVDFDNLLQTELLEKHIRRMGNVDLVDEIWEDRPPMSAEPIWELTESQTGVSRKDKLRQIREIMVKMQTDVFIFSALDEIAWATNLRGNDVACTPVFLSFLIISPSDAALFVSPSALSGEIRGRLENDGFRILPYAEIESTVKKLRFRRVGFDGTSLNSRIFSLFKRFCIPSNTASPIQRLKAVKNTTEQNNLRAAHLKDGVALTHFLYWLTNFAADDNATECSAAKKMEAYRSEQPGYIEPSFEPIIAYAEHGAVVHYKATPETDVPFRKKGLCLVDSGGQYEDGTTDVTRTVAMGELTDEEKKAFTLVMIGHLRLQAAVFPECVTGADLDALARVPLWKEGLDYLHGTGHGVGYILSVHENPPRISRKNKNPQPFEIGMVVSDEPGYYRENAFGIRHENLELVCAAKKSAYGQFLCFEPLTVVPFDRNALLTSLMSEEDKRLFNAYQASVYEKFSPFFRGEELNWLRNLTLPIE